MTSLVETHSVHFILKALKTPIIKNKQTKQGNFNSLFPKLIGPRTPLSTTLMVQWDPMSENGSHLPSLSQPLGPVWWEGRTAQMEAGRASRTDWDGSRDLGVAAGARPGGWEACMPPNLLLSLACKAIKHASNILACARPFPKTISF